MTRTLTPAQRLMFTGALAFLASGVFHVAVWLLAGMPSLEGPVSWRKPIAFGLSTGLLSLSLTWVIGLLPQTVRLSRQVTTYVALIAGELLLINMQQWRGVGSHFNSVTAFDGAVFTTMGVMIMIVAILIAIWTRALFKPLSIDPAQALAARAGMVLLNAGNLIGVFISVWGSMQVAAGLTPNIFGDAGQLKIPHAVALHAIQVLPVIAWLVHRSVRRLHAMRAATIGYSTLLIFALVQAFSGRAPHDVTITSAAVLIVSLVLMGWSVASAAIARRDERCDMLREWDVAR